MIYLGSFYLYIQNRLVEIDVDRNIFFILIFAERNCDLYHCHHYNKTAVENKFHGC